MVAGRVQGPGCRVWGVGFPEKAIIHTQARARTRTHTRTHRHRHANTHITLRPPTHKGTHVHTAHPNTNKNTLSPGKRGGSPCMLDVRACYSVVT